MTSIRQAAGCMDLVLLEDAIGIKSAFGMMVATCCRSYEVVLESRADVAPLREADKFTEEHGAGSARRGTSCQLGLTLIFLLDILLSFFLHNCNFLRLPSSLRIVRRRETDCKMVTLFESKTSRNDPKTLSVSRDTLEPEEASVEVVGSRESGSVAKTRGRGRAAVRSRLLRSSFAPCELLPLAYQKFQNF